MEFLEKVPQGIHSMAGDAGKMLSGGQRQLISLARAILKDAPIVVLDEATAYADPENEEKMEAAIAELVKDKTLVVIAHKLPAIMNADQICVVDHGKLVAAGKHQDLIQSCPEYQKAVEGGPGQRRMEHTHRKGGELNVCTVFKDFETLLVHIKGVFRALLPARLWSRSCLKCRSSWPLWC